MSYLGRFYRYGAILVHIATVIVAYHFDVDNVILYEDVAKKEPFRGSYFGFSVILWNASSEESWIFIGAPRANVTAYSGMNEPGTVFKCGIGKPCKEWIIGTLDLSEPQDGSWLGGSMGIGKDNKIDTLVVCAPRWLNKKSGELMWLMSGMCYKAEASAFSDRNHSVGKAVRPLDKLPVVFKTDKSYAMGQSGFSTHVLPDPKFLRYVLGCPGVWLSHGTPILSDFDNPFNTPNPISTSVDADAYSGYAVTSGLYFRASNRIFVTGAPRAENLRGKVVLFHFQRFNTRHPKEIKVHSTRTGHQIGEYFGSALASCDIDNDGRDDLLVGAPQSGDFDQGGIYIFRGNTDGSETFKDEKFIPGKELRGRFGSVITCLGDIDHDGYADVAVGAPFDGNGAVYIYHGSLKGLRPTQKISAPKGVKGFGISISEARDIDNNDYADIAVGAYFSGHVAVFRSKRIVSMVVTFSSDLLGQALRHNADSFVVSLCSSYNGKYAPQQLNVTNELKITDVNKRAEIDIEGKGPRQIYKYTEIIRKFNTSCSNFTIIIKKGIQDFSKPLKVFMTQRLNTRNESGILRVKENSTTGNEYFNKSSTVIQTPGDIHEYLEIPFAVKCANDTACISELSVNMTTDLKNINHWVIGSTPYIKLNITVFNSGKQAYLTRAIVSVPNIISLRFMPRTCMRRATTDDIVCEIGDPLYKNDTGTVTLELDMSEVKSDTEEIHFSAILTTLSDSTPSAKLNSSLLITCVKETDIGIAGHADPDSVNYFSKGKEEQLPSIIFHQIYEIKNYKATPLTAALLSVSVPTYWLHDGNEIEILMINKTTGVLDGREFSCTDREKGTDISLSSHEAFIMTESSIGNNRTVRFAPQEEKQFDIVEGRTLDTFLDNRTLRINCSVTSFRCITMDCKLGRFASAQSVAKLVLKFALLLPNFTPELIKKNDIIYFATNASTKTTDQTINDKPDSIHIGTSFFGSAPQSPLSAWVIPVSVFVGLLLLIFVILGLVKSGFFKRSQKAKLQELLKDRDNMDPKVVLETTSSTEALDAPYYIK